MANRRISTIVMAVLGVLMLVSIFLPYVKNTTDDTLTYSLLQIASGDVRGTIEADGKTIFVITAITVGLVSLLSIASLTGKKIFGVFAIIISLVVAGFHGLLSAGLSERDGVGIGIGFWFILIASIVLFVTSIVFVARKPKLA
ncbi:MAG: DUF5336 domain-containing protein [Chloroflexi bacterium]|nr:DUF5336 domain-containing protein [Chloroflexota bacterium]